MTHTIVFFDLETGGLDFTRHPIIQLAAVAADPDGTILAEFEAKLAFDEAQADPRALAMNHYTPAAWEAARPETEVLHRFDDWLLPFCDIEKTSAKGQPYRLAQAGGHNAGAFDYPFLRAAHQRHGHFFPVDYHIIDTVTMAYMVAMVTGRHPPSYRLTDLCEFHGIPIAKAHDALADVRATAHLAFTLLAQFRPAV